MSNKFFFTILANKPMKCDKSFICFHCWLCLWQPLRLGLLSWARQKNYARKNFHRRSWVKQEFTLGIQEDCDHVEDSERPGAHSTSTNVGNVEKVKELFMNEHRMTIRAPDDDIVISRGNKICSIICWNLLRSHIKTVDITWIYWCDVEISERLNHCGGGILASQHRKIIRQVQGHFPKKSAGFVK